MLKLGPDGERFFPMSDDIPKTLENMENYA